MDYAFAKGLESGFGLLGEAVLQDRKRALDEQSEERKTKMRAKLEMDLMKAKYAFMRENPQYKHFATNLNGDIVGFDQYGSPRVMYTASPEEKAIRLGKAQADIDTKTAQGDAALRRAAAAEAVVPSTIAKNTALGAAATHRANAPYPTPKAGAKDPMVITPAQKEKIIQSLMPKDVLENALPEDEDYQKFRSQAEQKFDAMGYKLAVPKLGVAAPDLGVFAAGVPGMIAPADDGDDEEPDDDEDDEATGLLN